MKSIGKYLFEGIVILISILGAFWLEEWRDNNEKRKKVSQAISAIKTEIKMNSNTIKQDYENFKTLQPMVELAGEITLTDFQFDSLRTLYPDNKRLFNNMSVVDSLPDGSKKYRVIVEFFFMPGDFSNAAYESVKNSGILVEIDIETSKYIFYCYEWIYKDYGLNVSAMNKSLADLMAGTGQFNESEFKSTLATLIEIYQIKNTMFQDSLLGPTFKLMQRYTSN